MIDPEAAKIALNADFPSITIAGNVANQVMSTQQYLDEVYQVKNRYTELFHKYYGHDFPFWDETAAALMVDPSISRNHSTGMYFPDYFYSTTALTSFDQSILMSMSHMEVPVTETSKSTRKCSPPLTSVM